jgi:hypothetical protein
MLQSFALYQILGFPLIMYGGITVLILLLTTATIGFLHKNIKLHVWLARITIVVAIGHAILGISIFIK